MGRYHIAAGCSHFFPQLLENQQVFDIFVKPENQYITLIGGELVSPKYPDAPFLGQPVNFGAIPDNLMLGKAYAVKFQTPGFLNKLLRVNIAAG
jgi:hypothetical protein